MDTIRHKAVTYQEDDWSKKLWINFQSHVHLATLESYYPDTKLKREAHE